jgi:hypothetical protein
MFVFLVLAGCFSPNQIIESSNDSIIKSSIGEKQILINVEEIPKVQKLRFVTGKVDKIRLTNETAIYFAHEQTQNN